MPPQLSAKPTLEIRRQTSAHHQHLINQKASFSAHPRQPVNMPVCPPLLYEAQVQLAIRAQRKKIETLILNTEPQILPHEAEACQSTKAEPTYPAVDPVEDR